MITPNRFLIFADLGYYLGDFPESERASREVLSLPMHPFLQEQEQDRVVECLVKHAEQAR